MADQLTSIGVEFSKVEMNRIFYGLRPGATACKWGMGAIHNPAGATSYSDKIWVFFAAPYRKIKNGNTEYPTRRPGGYNTADDYDDLLTDPNELVHPCVRIRYLYGGQTLDNAGQWNCRALNAHGYKLKAQSSPATPIRPSRVDGAILPYPTVDGAVTPFYDTPPSNIGSDTIAVRTEQPNGLDDLYILPNPKGTGCGSTMTRPSLPLQRSTLVCGSACSSRTTKSSCRGMSESRPPRSKGEEAQG